MRIIALYKFPGFQILFLVVDDHPVDGGIEQIPYGPLNDGQVRMNPGRRGSRFVFDQNIFPERVQEIHVSFDVLGGHGFTRRAHDVSGSWLAVLAYKFLESFPFIFVLDSPADADLLDRGHVDHIPARQGDVARQPGAFGAKGLFTDLDDDVLAVFEQVLDVALFFPTARSSSDEVTMRSVLLLVLAAIVFVPVAEVVAFKIEVIVVF